MCEGAGGEAPFAPAWRPASQVFFAPSLVAGEGSQDSVVPGAAPASTCREQACAFAIAPWRKLKMDAPFQNRFHFCIGFRTAFPPALVGSRTGTRSTSPRAVVAAPPASVGRAQTKGWKRAKRREVGPLSSYGSGVQNSAEAQELLPCLDSLSLPLRSCSWVKLGGAPGL